jgi:uncharacterized protein
LAHKHPLIHISSNSNRADIIAAYARALITIVLGLILSACESTPRDGQSTHPEITVVKAPEQQILESSEQGAPPETQDDPTILAQNKINEARYMSGGRKAKTQLEAAGLLMYSGKTLTASNVLSEISQASLQFSDRQTYRILLATARYRNADYTAAWRYVQQITLQNIEQRDELQKYWRLRGFLEYRLGRIADALNSLVNHERYLNNTLARSQNQQQIRLIIDSLDFAQIADIRANSVSPEVLNRLTESYAAINVSPYATTYMSGTSYKMLQTPSWGPNAPRNIALLLPMSSRFSSSALAVEEGFRDAQRNDPSPRKPNVRLIDTGADTSLAGRYYENAALSGIDFIVGPLGRDAARYVSDIATGSTPTLMLGTPDNPGYRPNSNLTHFDFSPENEANTVAQKMFQEGHRTIATLRPNQNWSVRYFESFRAHWLSLGGKISRDQIYFEGAVDFSREIRSLLGVDVSERRKSSLQSALGLNISFQPRRDRSLDAILLLARPDAGRLIRPQLSFYQGHDLDVYASSHIYSASVDAANNRDLDDTVFPIITSALQPTPNTPLHALGADAYFLVSALSQNTLNSISFAGGSGLVTLNKNGSITRSPSWARFEQGELHAVIESEQTSLKPLPPAPVENDDFNRTISAPSN